MPRVHRTGPSLGLSPSEDTDMAGTDERDPKQGAGTNPKTDPAKDPAAGPPVEPDPEAGMDKEVGDLDDPDAVDDEGALPGRMGGGLAGG